MASGRAPRAARLGTWDRKGHRTRRSGAGRARGTETRRQMECRSGYNQMDPRLCARRGFETLTLVLRCVHQHVVLVRPGRRRHGIPVGGRHLAGIPAAARPNDRVLTGYRAALAGSCRWLCHGPASFHPILESPVSSNTCSGVGIPIMQPTYAKTSLDIPTLVRETIQHGGFC